MALGTMGFWRFLSRPCAPRNVSPFVLPHWSRTGFSSSVAAMATWPAFFNFFLSSRRLRVALPWVCPGLTLAVLSGVALLAIVASGVVTQSFAAPF